MPIPDLSIHGVNISDMSREQLMELAHCLWRRGCVRNDILNARINFMHNWHDEDHRAVEAAVPWPAFCNPDRFLKATP